MFGAFFCFCLFVACVFFSLMVFPFFFLFVGLFVRVWSDGRDRGQTFWPVKGTVLLISCFSTKFYSLFDIRFGWLILSGFVLQPLFFLFSLCFCKWFAFGTGSEQAAHCVWEDLRHHKPERCHQEHPQAGCQLPDWDHSAGQGGKTCCNWSHEKCISKMVILWWSYEEIMVFV